MNTAPEAAALAVAPLLDLWFWSDDGAVLCGVLRGRFVFLTIAELRLAEGWATTDRGLARLGLPLRDALTIRRHPEPERSRKAVIITSLNDPAFDRIPAAWLPDFGEAPVLDCWHYDGELLVGQVRPYPDELEYSDEGPVPVLSNKVLVFAPELGWTRTAHCLYRLGYPAAAGGAA